MSTSIFIILLAVLQQSSGIFGASRDAYRVQVAQEAAEAGLAYAESCLVKNDFRQVWGPDYFGGGGSDRPNLEGHTSCTGTANAAPDARYVLDTNSLRSRFVVAALDTNSSQDAVTITSTGYSEKLSSGNVIETKAFRLQKTIARNPLTPSYSYASSPNHACFVRSGNAFCWGDNAVGQLGIEPTSVLSTSTPTAVARGSAPGGIGNQSVTKIVTGEDFSCSLLTNGRVYCWGDNTYGQLGDGTTTERRTPTAVVGAVGTSTITDITASRHGACALRDTGIIYCWGKGDAGQLGDGTTGVGHARETPIQIAGPGSVSPVGGAIGASVVTSLGSSSASSESYCAISSNQAYCWGANDVGQLGDDSTTNRDRPIAVSTSGVLSGRNVSDIQTAGDATTDAHTCVLSYVTSTSNPRVACWGSHSYGQVGTGSSDWSSPILTPTAVNTSGSLTNSMTVTDLALTETGTCVIAYATDVANKRVHCWGESLTLGNGPAAPLRTATPTAVQDPTGLITTTQNTFMTSGYGQMCTVVYAEPHCWGENAFGQLGNATAASPGLYPARAVWFGLPRQSVVF